MGRILDSHIHHKVDELDSRLSAVEEALPEVLKAINEIDDLIAMITRVNKEILYRIQKAQLKDKGHRQGSF